MKKFDSLVKKVELFEKLAKHGDRSSFLKSFAQGAPAPDAKALVNQIKAIMNRAKVNDENLNNMMGNVSMFGKSDPDSLSQAAQAAKKLMTMISPLAYPDAAKDQNALRDIASKLVSLAPADHSEHDISTHDNVGGGLVNKTPHGFTPINEKVQQAISKAVVSEGVGLPLDIDGNLGTETRKAITRFKKYVMKNEQASDQEAFQKALELYS